MNHALRPRVERTKVRTFAPSLTGEAKPGEKAPPAAFLCAVDRQTKLVTAIPVPSKDGFGLKYVVQQLVSATAGMCDVRLLIRTDQEPGQR